MNNHKWKHPNAQKHGVFAQSPIISGEDPAEFKELHSALVAEWAPNGATEEEAVFTIASAMWRKRRAKDFLEIQLLRNAVDIRHPGFDENLGLDMFACSMKATPETAFETYASRLLRDDKIKYLEEKFPRTKYKSTSEWAAAVINEIRSVLAPPTSNELPEVPDGGLEKMKKIEAFQLYVLSGDLFTQELALIERLDAMIDRAIKRLIQTKAMKQMLRQASPERVDDQPRKSATVANGPGKIVSHPRR
jgi:hypothetical protein